MELVASSSANALRQTARLDDKHRSEEKEGRSAAHILSVCPYILHYGTLDVLNVLNSRSCVSDYRITKDFLTRTATP